MNGTHKSCGGKKLGCKPNVERSKEVNHVWIFCDYFPMQLVYNDKCFRHRFWMCRNLFLKIMEAIVVHDFYFVQKRNVTRLLGLSSIHKCTSTIKMLAYDVAADYINKYCRLNESIALECLKRFVKTIRTCFESNYLKQPTLVDVKKQTKINKKRRFLDMFASIDFMH